MLAVWIGYVSLVLIIPFQILLALGLHWGEFSLAEHYTAGIALVLGM